MANKAPPTQPPTRWPALLSLRELASYTGHSLRTIEAMRADDRLPPAVKVPGVSSVRYRKTDIDEWIAELGNEKR